NAPTGTSSCASAARASSSARPITASYSWGSGALLLDELTRLLRRREEVLQHLAARVVWEVVAELDLGRHLEPGQRGGDPLLHVGLRQRAGGVRHHERGDLLPERRVLDAGDRDLGDLGMLEQAVLDLD